MELSPTYPLEVEGPNDSFDSLQEPEQVLEGFLEEDHVVPHILYGGIDLMGDPGGQLPNGFQLLGLGELPLE